MNINEVVTKAIYDKLILDADILALIKETANHSSTYYNLNRVWFGAAPPQLTNAFPYVLITYASGGILNDAPYEAADITLMVSGVNQTVGNAKALDSLIAENLRRQTLTYPDGWHSWSTVRQLDAFSRVENVQNAQYWQSGNYYRFRLSKGI